MRKYYSVANEVFYTDLQGETRAIGAHEQASRKRIAYWLQRAYDAGREDQCNLIKGSLRIPL